MVVIPDILALFFTSKFPDISEYKPYRLEIVNASLLEISGLKLVAILFEYWLNNHHVLSCGFLTKPVWVVIAGLDPVSLV